MLRREVDSNLYHFTVMFATLYKLLFLYYGCVKSMSDKEKMTNKQNKDEEHKFCCFCAYFTFRMLSMHV